MNDVDIKTLINSAVDVELGGYRATPPWNLSRLPERRHAMHPVARWSLPALAASVAALLAAGTVMAIGHGQDRRPIPVAHPATPTSSASPSLSHSTNPDQAAAKRAYAEAVAGARQATQVAGVSVGPISAKDAVRFKNSGVIRADPEIMAPEPGKTYSFTWSYLAGPSDEPPAVLTAEVRDVAAGSCAHPFLVRPGHTYTIHCQAMLLAGVTGKSTLTMRSPSGTSSASINLTDPAKNPASPSESNSISLPPSQAVTAREYAEAVAAAPEASKVAGVSDQFASGGQGERGQGFGTVNGPVPAPKPGRSYSVTLLYVSGTDQPPVSVLALSIEDVAASRCPRAFRTRRNHSYEIRCQVTFRTGRVAKAYYNLLTPQGRNTTGTTLDSP